MKMRHRMTGEIVVVVGMLNKNKNGVFAKCYCDARLHPGRACKKQGVPCAGTVICEINFNLLQPVERPNWDDIASSYYDDGEFETILTKAKEEYVKSVQSTGNSIYNNEKARLIKEGECDEETAEYLANAKRREFLQSKLNQQKAEKPVLRDTNW